MLCGSGWPQTCYLPASVPQELELLAVPLCLALCRELAEDLTGLKENDWEQDNHDVILTETVLYDQKTIFFSCGHREGYIPQPHPLPSQCHVTSSCQWSMSRSEKSFPACGRKQGSPLLSDSHPLTWLNGRTPGKRWPYFLEECHDRKPPDWQEQETIFCWIKALRFQDLSFRLLPLLTLTNTIQCSPLLTHDKNSITTNKWGLQSEGKCMLMVRIQLVSWKVIWFGVTWEEEAVPLLLLILLHVECLTSLILSWVGQRAIS